MSGTSSATQPSPAARPESPAELHEVEMVTRRTPSGLLRRLTLMVLVPALLIAGALMAYLNTGGNVTTENAYVKAHIADVAPEVAGRIVEVAVEENEHVDEGDLLFVIDHEPFRIALEGARARLAEVETDIAYDRRAYRSALSEITLHASTVEYARSQLARQQALVEHNLGRTEDLDTARYELVSAERRVEIAQQHAETLLAKLNQDPDIPFEAHPAWRSAKKEVDSAELDLQRTRVHAPFAGIVARRPEPGTYVFPFAPVVAVVSDENVWVEANFKETQLTHMSPGQSVELSVDAYPGERWHGRVESISQSTGAQFAMLPPQNATGNWVKVVQRIPVRIVVEDDHPDRVLRAGMSCEVKVDTGYQRHLSDLIHDW